MLKTLSSLSILASFALALPVLAQDTGTSDQGASQSGDAASQLLDLGSPANGEPQVGTRYSKEKYGDWDLACIKTETDQDPCSLLQVMKDDKGQPMAEFSLFRLEGGGQAVAGASVIVPLETLLPAQLTISVDGAPGKRYQYSFCNPIGCVAQIGLTEEDVAALKKGKEAEISLVPAPAPDQLVKLHLSLNGFTSGYEVTDVVKNQ